MTKYDIYRRTFVLSLLSNFGSKFTGTQAHIEEKLHKNIGKYLSSTVFRAPMGTWEMVWGPRVFQHSTSTPFCDNTMVVFHCQEENLYVVAMAGTNPYSMYDWTKEDFDVNTSVAWANDPASGARISRATDTGLNHLLGMPFGAAGDPSLEQFLEKVGDRAASTVIFTGHSLGGALAPTLALFLFGPNGPLANAGWKTVRVFPTAGASPGNQAFADLFATTFPACNDPAVAEPYSGWNKVVRNTLDIVPHAWSLDGLAALPTLYGKPIDDVALLVTGAMLWAGGKYVPLPATEFNWTVHSTVSDIGEYLSEAAYQHVQAYMIQFGVPPLTAGAGETGSVAELQDLADLLYNAIVEQLRPHVHEALVRMKGISR